jgi:membrane-associated protease RseP (regulator of RpoE activity)
MDLFWDSLLRHVETIVTLPLCLLTVLVVHELGHYLAARAQGLHVESVTFGRGRLLWSWQDRDGTSWRLHLWPLRAHVQISDFQSADLPLRKKLFVILAGPLANFVLPFFLFFLFFTSIGQPAIPNIVTAIEPDMPAYKAGLRPGDQILSINGQDVRSMDDILYFTEPRPTKPLRVHFVRNGVHFETSVKPVWARYRDLDGVLREHGRIGLTTWQQAYMLEVVRSVNGVPTPTEDDARAALLKHMGQRIEIGLWSMDGKVYNSVMDLSAESNRNIENPRHKEHHRFYLGALRDNFYLPLSPKDSAKEAFGRSAEMLGHVVLLPFNLFPIDKEWITPDAVVSRETSYLQVRLYVFVFFASLCSCFIGFLNLLPFPKLDGGEALLLIGEGWKRRPLLNAEKATVLVLGLLVFYAAVFGANMNDLRGYYLFQMQKALAAEKASP